MRQTDTETDMYGIPATKDTHTHTHTVKFPHTESNVRTLRGRAAITSHRTAIAISETWPWPCKLTATSCKQLH